MTGVLLGYLGWIFCFGVWNELRDGEKHRDGEEREKEGARGLMEFIEAGFKFPGLCGISLGSSRAPSTSFGRDYFLIKLRFTDPGPSLGNVLRKCS